MSDGTQAGRRGREAHAGVMVSPLVHNLKQPLNLIRVIAQQVRLDVTRERLDVAALPADMSEIEQAVDELVRRIDALRVMIEPAAEDATLVASPEDACTKAVGRALAERSSTRVEQMAFGPLPAVVATSERLEQAVWELLDNAANALQASGRDGAVRVSAECDGDQVTINVDDDGGGVSEALRESIFEPFFTTRAKATGLGLPFAVALVRAGRGRIVLARSSEQGSRFQIVLEAVTP